MSDSPPPSTPKRRSAEERREEIIAAAIVEFATFGYHGGSTERIAASAGISQPYVLRLFGSKKAIFLAALDRVCANIVATWRTADALLGEQIATPSPAQRLAAMGEAFGGLVREVHDLRLVLQAFSSSEDDDIRAVSQRALNDMFDWVWQTTAAPIDDVRAFFATGMMLMVAASIDAPAATDSPWARAFLMWPLDERGELAPERASLPTASRVTITPPS